MAPIATAPTGTGATAPFRHPLFLSIWLASLASNFGSLIQGVGASWLMTTIAPTADLVALVQASTALPIMLFSLVAGAAADVFDRRAVMLAAQLFMLAVSGLLCLATVAGMVTPAVLLAFTFLIGCGAAMFGPAWQSSVGEMVPRAELPQAVALNSLGFNIARTLGPAIGGLVVASAGAKAAFLFNAVTYLGLIAVLVLWRRAPAPRTLPRENMGAAMAAGVRYAALSPSMRRVLLRTFAFGLFGSAVWALMPLIAKERVGGGPLTYGLLLGAFGLGAVVSAFFSTALRRKSSAEAVAVAATLAFALASAVAAASTVLWGTMLGLLAGGAGWVLALSTFNVQVQMSSPRWVVGRTMAIYQTVTFGGMAAGSWLWGLTAHAAGLPAALAAAAAGLAASLVLARLAPLADDLSADLDPHGRWAPPHPALDVTAASGPVVTTIEYRVPAARRDAFVAVMGEVRRIRRRDGAHGWTLLRDLAAPDLWVERFETPSWVDHLRLYERSTVDDYATLERLAGFHAGDRPPTVRRFLERPAAALERPRPQADAAPAAMLDPTLPPTRFGAGRAPAQERVRSP